MCVCERERSRCQCWPARLRRLPEAYWFIINEITAIICSEDLHSHASAGWPRHYRRNEGGTPSLPLSLSFSLFHFLCLSQSLSLSLCFSRSLSLTLSLSLSLSLCFSQSLSLTLSLSLSLSVCLLFPLFSSLSSFYSLFPSFSLD